MKSSVADGMSGRMVPVRDPNVCLPRYYHSMLQPHLGAAE
jgi:hypothetical protein